MAVAATGVGHSGGAVSVHYDVTIKGEPGEMLLGAFSDVTVRKARGATVLSADLDQAGLHGLLRRVADLGVELVGVRLVAGADNSGGEGREMT